MEEISEVKTDSLKTMVWQIIFIYWYAIIVDETQFVSLCKRRSTQLRTLSLVEVNESLIIAIKYSQLVHFWSLLRKSSQKSRILSKPFVRLSPYLDSEGIIRVVSCLNNSQIPDRQKHLVLLSKTSHLSKLIVHHWHVLSCHYDNRLMNSIISIQFWILSVRMVIGINIKNCSTCVWITTVNP